jgi:DNA-binding PadR family transcriptional regulator
MLADLDPVHIRVLKIMSRRPKHLDRIAEQMNAAGDPKAVRQWYEWSIVHTDPGLEGAVYGALQVLERHGLIWDRGAAPVPPPHGIQHEYEISPYGGYLIDRLAEPA